MARKPDTKIIIRRPAADVLAELAALAK